MSQAIDAEPLMAPVVELGEHEDRDDEVFVGLADQSGAATVIGVGCVQRREQRTGVEHQWHLRRWVRDRMRGHLGGGAAVRGSGDPQARATRGVQGAAFSSMASASTAVSATPRRRASASSVSSDERLAVTVVRRIAFAEGVFAEDA